MVEKILGAQRDFSFGEVDPALKRSDDHPARKAGLRQMANARILNSRALQDRPGRRALYPITNSGIRTDRFTITSGNVFDIQFAAGRLKIIDNTGTTVGNFTLQGNGAALPWASASDIQSINFVLVNLSIYICFGHSMRPQVVTWDGVSTWTIADYQEAVVPSGQKRTPFYRISPQNITMLPSAARGAITLKFSSPIVVAGMAGTRMRFAGRQMLLGTMIDSSNINAVVIEPLPHSVTLTVGSVNGVFAIGDVVDGSVSGAQGIVTSSPVNQIVNASGVAIFQVGDAITDATNGATGTIAGISGLPGIAVTFNVNLVNGTAFGAGHTITGPHGSLTTTVVSGISLVLQMLIVNGITRDYSASETIAGPSGTATTTAAVTVIAPTAISDWDDEVMNDFRGYPASVFADQFRLGFCDFPSVPGGIQWSTINYQTDIYDDDASSPDNGFFEVVPGKVRVYYVVAGPESNEFVFCDRRVYYIPISPTNPLKAGSVQFLLLSGDGSAQVQPRLAQEAILYVNAGANSVMAVIATGAFLRPFNTKNLSEFHAHLFNNIQCIAAPSADGTFNERYTYVLNGDGSTAVGKYDPETLPSQIVPTIGWGPWSGGATVSWIAAYRADVLFTSTYFGAGVVEILDDTQYLDCALAVNAAPAAFGPPGGKGPLWFIPSQSVTLIDQVTRVMGTYQIDANGFIIAQFNGGEDLTVSTLVAGQPWTLTVEPFAPDADAGKSVGQRMFPRRVARFAAYVAHSSGFKMSRLFSGPITPTSPALGTEMNFTRFPAWNVGDDATKPPPQREITERTRPIGRSFDPRVAIIKDTPGPLQLLEIGLEVTI
jgi:hypothetical protein